MKILWVVNHQMLDVAKKTGKPIPQSGSWLIRSSKELSYKENINLYIVCPTKDKLQQLKINKITYILLPVSYYDMMIYPTNKIKIKIDQIIDNLKPDIIHLQGSEFAFGLAFIQQNKVPTVLSIQGLISEITKNNYAFCGMGKIDVFTFIIEKLKHYRNKKRAKAEILQLKNVKYRIGRTLWDECHSFFYNPHGNYFFLQEIIRESFLKNMWSIENIEPYTIFCGGGYASPLKGAHRIILAVSMLIQEFPRIKLRIPGPNPFKSNQIIGYSRYIKKLIIDLEMEKHVQFIDKLNEIEMMMEFKKCHIYVMGSSIENSSNTLGEAMCMGVPIIVPFVGGIPSLVTDEHEALYYRFEDIAQMAWQIRRILLDRSLAVKLGVNARKKAEKTYVSDAITNRLVEIYKEIINTHNVQGEFYETVD
jgi:glycosyltransferase involved in cell wall biosynthesis